MEQYLENVKTQLEKLTEQYKQLSGSEYFSCTEWQEKVKCLEPYVIELREHAEQRLTICEQHEQENEKKSAEATAERIRLYEEYKQGKGKLSNLDISRIKHYNEISSLSKEIEEDNGKIMELQNAFAKTKADKEYWDTVFWATCWIPFSDIGTGCKKNYETGQYEAKARGYDEDIARKRRRIEELTGSIRRIENEQKETQESSGRLANLITAIEGEIAIQTTILNDLRHEKALWQPILLTCMELQVELEYTDGNLQKVKDGFHKLLEVEALLESPVTDHYIAGCHYKGTHLSAGDKLLQNEYLLSENRRFAVIMQSDNNFVLYNSEKPLWASDTCNAVGKGYVELSTDGIASLRDIDQSWDTKRQGAVELIMQNDGNLVAYDASHQALWASDTYIYANLPGIYFAIH